ncbi:JAB domain-containing protein [Cytobacillus kochii]|uniref:JAB domain-containing protein n=1 Tax=Cytobacillus kochii TaxID=859143 RepID=UPI0025A19AC9|nr:JAB domain-containing protein [Cytobacillus kochii]MDM5205344.1 JAB domain-containing protein [Cytobacillus kochii]
MAKKNENLQMVKEIVRIKQVVTKGEVARERIGSPADAVAIATEYIGDEDREVLLVMVLNTKNKLNAIHRCHVGSINASIVHPREVMKAAILNNGASIIVAHNHPSYDPSPSRQDIEVTQRLKEVGTLLGIELLDSLIVSDDPMKFVSLKEKGYL